MRLISLLIRHCFPLPLLLGLAACEKDNIGRCSDQTTSASFKVNEFDFTDLEVIAWSKNGASNTVLFMQQLPNGDQHVVNVIFVGDSMGTYPLLGINAANRASYFAPGVNGTTFPDTVIPGTLVITNFDTDPACLTGNYSFEVDTLQISGKFQSLRPD